MICIRIVTDQSMPSSTRAGTVSPSKPVVQPRLRKGRRRRCARAADNRVKAVYAVERSSGPGGSLKSVHDRAEVEIVCERLGCEEDVECCLHLVDSCLGTARLNARQWAHVTLGEHYCIECRNAILNPGGRYNVVYTEWRQAWLAASRREPSPRIFVADALLPYYLRCTECRTWRTYRQMVTPIQPSFIDSFTCAKSVEFEESDAQCKPCLVGEGEGQIRLDIWNPLNGMDKIEDDYAMLSPEEEGIDRPPTTDEEAWLAALMTPLLLHHSPTLFFLRDYYFNDEIGQSCVYGMHSDDARDDALTPISAPFNIPGEPMMAQCVRPDVQEFDELMALPEYSNEPSVYLGLRNMLIALWHLQPKQWLSCAMAERRVNCRGLMRIHACQVLRRVWRVLSVRGMINSGCVLPPHIKPLPSSPSRSKSPSDYTVAIVGAGIAGLTCAAQLTKHGVRCVVLEATETLGGRMRDDWSLGVAVGMGAQLLTGIVNNPINMMCYQCGVDYRPVGDECPLIDVTTGGVADANADKRVDFHFNCLLDAIDEWRTACLPKQPSVVRAATLQEQMHNMHNQFIDRSGAKWSPDEERCIQWQWGNVEFSCGARLSDVSAAYWDQNEVYAQFAGPHALLPDGSEVFLRSLAASLDIRYNSPVTHIDRTENKGKIVLTTASNAKANRVIKADKADDLNVVKYTPPLPAAKIESINALGAGCIEKVAVQFPRRFWASLVGDSDYFGHVPRHAKTRGLFNMFYDLSSTRTSTDDPTATYVLMSYVCGDNVNLVNELGDEQVVDRMMLVLRDLYSTVDVPDPIGHVVTHWRRDPNFGMSYSYVRAGGTGDDYDKIAECTADRRLYFAGEATNRLYPQTMTGACMTGYREAARIIAHLGEGEKQ